MTSLFWINIGWGNGTSGWHYTRADSRFAPSQWETALLCNDVSHWLGASLESALLHEPMWIYREWDLMEIYKWFCGMLCIPKSVWNHSKQQLLFSKKLRFNTLWPSDGLWQYVSRLTLAQVMAWCRQATSRYLLTKHQWGSVSITWGQFYKKYISLQLLELPQNDVSKNSVKSPRRVA